MNPNEVFTVPVHLIEVNPYQARKVFDYEGLNELKESIQQHGILQPIVVRRVGGRFQLIAGERRLRASKMAGLHQIPVIVLEKMPKDSAVLCLLENLQRKDLNPMETAEALAVLMREHEFNTDSLAQSLGKSRSTLSNLLRLLELPTSVQARLREGEITLGHAKAILSLKTNPEAAEALAETIVQKGLSVREAEALASNFHQPRDPLLPQTLTELEKAQVLEAKMISLLKRFYPKRFTLEKTTGGWHIHIQKEVNP